MEKEFISLDGKPFTADFPEHDISKYDVIFHVTPKENRDKIDREGLLIGQPANKSLIDHKMLFFSYPVNYNTGDCFRWYDDYLLVVLDAQELHGRNDGSSLKNHLATDVSIPRKFITKFLEF